MKAMAGKMEYHMDDGVVSVRYTRPSAIGSDVILVKRIDLSHCLHSSFVPEYLLNTEDDRAKMSKMTDLEASWYARYLDAAALEAGEPVILPKVHSKAWFDHALGPLKGEISKEILDFVRFFTIQRNLESLEATGKIARYILDNYPDLERAGSLIDEDFPSKFSAVQYLKARITLPGEPSKSIDLEALEPILHRFQVFEEDYKAAWRTFDAEDGVASNIKCQTLEAEIERINTEVLKNIPEIARATRNSVDALMSFKQTGQLGTWFNERPGKAMEHLIRHQSFNQEYCHRMDSLEIPNEISPRKTLMKMKR